jgi:hypothetical protein
MGGTLYFIRTDGTPCKYREPSEKKTPAAIEDKGSPKPEVTSLAIREDQCVVIEKGIRAKKIDALGGVVYVLTNENRIFRYSAETDTMRELTEAGSDNRDIAAYYQDLFVIKSAGSVKRYNEGRLKR